MKLVEAIPVRYERGAAFVTRESGCSLEDIRRPIFDHSPQAERLHAARVARGFGLRDAALALGLRAVELSGLENGRLVPESPSDWTLLEAALQNRT